jgi:hypothetical protein
MSEPVEKPKPKFTKKKPIDENYPLSVTDFCRVENISVYTYYALRKRGLAPKEFRIPTTQIVHIYPEERRKWRGADGFGRYTRTSRARTRATSSADCEGWQNSGSFAAPSSLQAARAHPKETRSPTQISSRGGVMVMTTIIAAPPGWLCAHRQSRGEDTGLHMVGIAESKRKVCPQRTKLLT